LAAFFHTKDEKERFWGRWQVQRQHFVPSLKMHAPFLRKSRGITKRLARKKMKRVEGVWTGGWS